MPDIVLKAQDYYTLIGYAVHGDHGDDAVNAEVASSIRAICDRARNVAPPENTSALTPVCGYLGHDSMIMCTHPAGHPPVIHNGTFYSHHDANNGSWWNA